MYISLAARMGVSGGWRQVLWYCLTEGCAALMNLIAFVNTTEGASMRLWNNRPSVWQRFVCILYISVDGLYI